MRLAGSVYSSSLRPDSTSDPGLTASGSTIHGKDYLNSGQNGNRIPRFAGSIFFSQVGSVILLWRKLVIRFRILPLIRIRRLADPLHWEKFTLILGKIGAGSVYFSLRPDPTASGSPTLGKLNLGSG